MEEDNNIDAYNSDSGDGDFKIDEMSDDIGRPGGDGSNNMGWIQWFCQLEGHEYMVEVDDTFIKDPVNLFGLQTTLGKDKFK